MPQLAHFGCWLGNEMSPMHVLHAEIARRLEQRPVGGRAARSRSAGPGTAVRVVHAEAGVLRRLQDGARHGQADRGRRGQVVLDFRVVLAVRGEVHLRVGQRVVDPPEVVTQTPRVAGQRIRRICRRALGGRRRVDPAAVVREVEREVGGQRVALREVGLLLADRSASGPDSRNRPVRPPAGPCALRVEPVVDVDVEPVALLAEEDPAGGPSQQSVADQVRDRLCRSLGRRSALPVPCRPGPC